MGEIRPPRRPLEQPLRSHGPPWPRSRGAALGHPGPPLAGKARQTAAEQPSRPGLGQTVRAASASKTGRVCCVLSRDSPRPPAPLLSLPVHRSQVHCEPGATGTPSSPSRLFLGGRRGTNERRWGNQAVGRRVARVSAFTTALLRPEIRWQPWMTGWRGRAVGSVLHRSIVWHGGDPGQVSPHSASSPV